MLSQINFLSQKNKVEQGTSCGCIGNRLIKTKKEKLNKIDNRREKLVRPESDRKFGSKGIYSELLNSLETEEER